MASGYTVSGRGDLDGLFMARSSAKRGDVGYQVGGVDISNRYEPIGATTPIAATGFKFQNTDLANLFRGSAFAASASVDPTSFFNQASTPTFPSSTQATCTVVNNVGAPTYAWSRVSGSTKITVNSPSAATTSFLATGLNVSETAVATFKCTVTVDGNTFEANNVCEASMRRNA